MRHLLARLAAAALVAAAAIAVPTPPTAYAAACTGSGGVTVVVDYGSLGGGVGQACVGGGLASEQFPAAGYPLDYVQGEAGFVCRVKGAPADDPCTETSSERAFWSLWTTDGKSGRWSFATRGVTQLRVPEGGAVAFSWDDVAGYRPPTVTAPVTAVTSTPTPSSPATASQPPKPTTKPTKPTAQPVKPPTGRPSPKPSLPVEQQSPPGQRPSDAPSGEPSATSSESGSATESISPTPSPTGSSDAQSAVPAPTPGEPTPTDEPVVSPAAQQTTDSDGVPAWSVVLVLALLLAATAGVALQRRRTRSGP